MDLIVRQARRVGAGPELVDIAIADGRIAAVAPRVAADAAVEIDAGGRLVSPPFVDSHFHLDAVLTAGTPRRNASGTLLEGIELWRELQPLLRHDAIKERAREYLRWCVSQGILHLRSHVDTCQESLGGIPHYERSREAGVESIRLLMDRAQRRGLAVDMHCDETDDPTSRFVETLAEETIARDMQGRVTGSHLTSLHSVDNAYFAKLLGSLKEAEVTVVSNPLLNMITQARADTYPKRRGLTRVPELIAAGINVSFGHDCTLDPWYPLGAADMLEVASMGVHACQMSGERELGLMFDAVTACGARTLGLEDYGLDVGCAGDLVLLDAVSVADALRTQPVRLAVVRRGAVVASATAPARAVLGCGLEGTVDFVQPSFQ